MCLFCRGDMGWCRCDMVWVNVYVVWVCYLLMGGVCRSLVRLFLLIYSCFNVF